MAEAEWLRYGDIDADEIMYVCSNCGAEIIIHWNKQEKFPTHCLKCGAKMEDNTMFYPQVEGITPTVIHTQEDNT